MSDNNRYPPEILQKAKAFVTNKWTLLITGLIVLGTAGLLSLPMISSALYSDEIDDRERLMNRNRTGIIIQDRSGEVLYQYGKINNLEDVSLKEVPDVFEQALIASEDQNFYDHPGYSLRGIIAALYANVRNQDPTRYGGSTITQQLVKNTLLTDSKDYIRKAKELAIATAIDRHYSKKEILEMYVNSVYFGEGSFGIHQAAQTYYDKHPSDLTLAESTMLVGLLPAPSTYSPMTGDMELAKQQQERVLELMVENGYIDKDQKATALNNKLAVQSPEPAIKHAHHFIEMVMVELKERYDEEEITRSGFHITTSLDLDWQKQAESNVGKQIEQLRNLGASNASLVAIDPGSGEVRALVGSSDWDNKRFGKANMAVSPRQPGSSFKPIYYTEAMDKGVITPATILKDEETRYGDYIPQNYDLRFRGNVTVRHALANSLNIPAIKVMERLGVADGAKAAQRMGIDTVNEPQKYGLTLALGTAEATLLDMTNAYAAFANKGTQYKPVIITSIKDKYDETVFEYEKRGKRVISPEASFLVSSILSETSTRHAVFNVLNIPGRDVAAKTGTTDDNKDAWTIGYAPNVSVGVWVGNNSNEPMNNVFGSNGAAPIWRQSIQSFMTDLPKEDFTRPSGIITVRVCRSNGKRAESAFEGTYVEYFMKSYPPQGICEKPEPEEPKKPDDDEEEKEEKEDDDEPRREANNNQDTDSERGGRGGEPEENNKEEKEKKEEKESTDSSGDTSSGDNQEDTTDQDGTTDSNTGSGSGSDTTEDSSTDSGSGSGSSGSTQDSDTTESTDTTESSDSASGNQTEP